MNDSREDLVERGEIQTEPKILSIYQLPLRSERTWNQGFPSVPLKIELCGSTLTHDQNINKPLRGFVTGTVHIGKNDGSRAICVFVLLQESIRTGGLYSSKILR